MASVAKDVQLSLGMISCTVRVESAQYSEDSLTNVCVGASGDTAHEPVAVTRPLTCTTCGPISMVGLQKAKKENGGLVVLNDTEVDNLKSDDSQYKGKIQFIPYSAAEVQNNTATGDKYYQLHPMASPENYALLCKVISAYPDKMFVARYAVRSKASLFVAQVKGSCLFIAERTFMDRLKPVPTFDTPANASFVDMAVSMVESMVSEFNPETFSDTYTNNLVTITRSREIVGGRTELTAPVSKKVTEELLAQAMIEYRAKRNATV